MAEDDNAKALISRVGLGHKWGDSDIFVLSIKGVTKKENPICSEKGGKNGTASTNNLWEPYEDWLCEDFVYAGWRHCEFTLHPVEGNGMAKADMVIRR